MSAAKDTKTPFGMVDVKSFSPGVEKVDFSEVDRQLGWNTLFNDFGLVTKSKDILLDILPNILYKIQREQSFGKDECYKWYCNKLIAQLNKTINNCIVSSVDVNLKAEEKKQLLAILNDEYIKQFNDKFNSLVSTIGLNIAGYFKGGAHRENVLSLIEVIDNPKLLNTDDMYNLTQDNIDGLMQPIQTIKRLSRPNQLLISQFITNFIPYDNIANYMTQGNLEFATKLESMKLEPLTWNNITLHKQALNAIHINLNILEPKLGDTVIAGIEACVINNFLKKLPDEEVIIVVKEFKSLIDGIKSNTLFLESYIYNYSL